MDLRPHRGVDMHVVKLGGARRRHLLFLEPHLQWSVLSHCLGPQDLKDALGKRKPDCECDPLRLLEEAARWVREDARVCARLQERLDDLASGWIQLTASCINLAQLDALWTSSKNKSCAGSVYWALISHGFGDDTFRRRLYRDFVSMPQRWLSGGGDAGLSETGENGIIRLSGEMLEALRREKEHSASLSAALQIESALRRQIDKQLEELQTSLAAQTVQSRTTG